MAKKIQWKYGRLNPIQKDKFKRRIETNSRNPLAHVRDATLDTLFNQSYDLSGEFVGVVLKTIIQKDVTDVFSKAYNIFSFFDDKPQKIEAKVRVPEAHALIPEPQDQNDLKSIALHDTFVAFHADLGTSKLEYGQLVVVSFYDAAGVWSPTIKRLYPAGSNVAALPESPTGASEAFTAPPQTDVLVDEPEFEFVGPILPANHIAKTRVEVVPAVPYTENRVRVHEGFTPIPPNSSLLVNVTPRPNRRRARLHRLVADRFNALRAAAALEGHEIYCHSGWRKHAWDSREDYEETMVERYGSVEEGKKWKAYSSPHETGMAVDFYIPETDNDIAIAPSMPGRPNYGSETNSQQKQTSAFKWLKENAHRYGFTPYRKEAWHWEVLLPIEAWKTGAEVTSNYDITDYNTRVIETSIANGKRTTDRDFTFE